MSNKVQKKEIINEIKNIVLRDCTDCTTSSLLPAPPLPSLSLECNYSEDAVDKTNTPAMNIDCTDCTASSEEEGSIFL